MWSPFVSLVERNIQPDFFFDSLIDDVDLSKLLCTCKSMKEAVKKWKYVFSIRVFFIERTLTRKMLLNMIHFYTPNVSKIVFLPHVQDYYYWDEVYKCLRSTTEKKRTIFKQWTKEKKTPLLPPEAYGLFSLFHSATNISCVLEISFHECLAGGILNAALCLKNLTSVTITESSAITKKDIDSLTNLNHLEQLSLNRCLLNSDDDLFVNYSALTKIKQIKFENIDREYFQDLNYLLSNKELSLVHLELIDLRGISSSEEFHCVTTLTNLTHLTVASCISTSLQYFHFNEMSLLDNIVLNMIITNCRLIQHLDIRNNNNCTIDGLENIHCLIYLETFKFSFATDSLLPKLSQIVALTRLDIWDDNKLSRQEMEIHIPHCYVFRHCSRYYGSTPADDF
jgi:hypothetical protein